MVLCEVVSFRMGNWERVRMGVNESEVDVPWAVKPVIMTSEAGIWQLEWFPLVGVSVSVREGAIVNVFYTV